MNGVLSGGFRRGCPVDAAFPESLRRNVVIPSSGMGRHSRRVLWYANGHNSVSYQHLGRIFVDCATGLVPMEDAEHILGPDSGRILSGSHFPAGNRPGDATGGLRELVRRIDAANDMHQA